MSLSRLQELVMDREALACYSPWHCKELYITVRLNWTDVLFLAALNNSKLCCDPNIKFGEYIKKFKRNKTISYFCFSCKINPDYECVQFSSVAQSCPILCNPMKCSMPGHPVHHQLLEPTQTHVHCVSDPIQPSHPLSSLSPPPSMFPSIRVFFDWVSFSHQVAKLLEFQLQDQSFQWIVRTDLL